MRQFLRREHQDTEAEKCGTARKYRQKTCEQLLAIDNALIGVTGVGLERFKVAPKIYMVVGHRISPVGCGLTSRCEALPEPSAEHENIGI